MKRLIILVIFITCLTNVHLNATISSNLTSSTYGFWITGGSPPSTGKPIPVASGAPDENYIVLGSASAFYWETLDGFDGQGAAELWIYDSAIRLDVNASNSNGPYWGLRSTDLGQILTVGVMRRSFNGGDTGYSIWSTVAPFSPFSFRDGVRGSQGVLFSAGWYKWKIDGTFDNITLTLFNVLAYQCDGPACRVDPPQIIDVIEVVDASSYGGVFAGVFGFGWSGLAFKGESGGPENFHMQITGGSGVYKDIGGTITSTTVSNPAISPNGGSFTSPVSVTITNSTSGSSIRYTTNGSTPTSSSTLYSGSIMVTTSMTLKAKAFKSGWTSSSVITATFTFNSLPVFTTVSISPSSGSTPPGNTVQFTAVAKDQNGTNLGSQPSFSWSVSGGGTISSAGKFTAGSVEGGPYTVTASATSGGITKSGTAAVTVESAWTGTGSWTQSAGSFTISNGVVTSIAQGGSDNNIAYSGDANWDNINYTVDVTPASGTNIWVIFRVTDGSNYYLYQFGNQSIYKVVAGKFTLIGSSSGGSYSTGTKYTIKVALDGTSIIVTTDGFPSATATDGTFSKGYVGVGGYQALARYENFSVPGAGSLPQEKVSANTITPSGGSYTDSVSVTISNSTSGSSIRYTTDGSAPASSSALYSASLTLTTSVTLKAKAFKTGWTSSTVTSAAFTIIPGNTNNTPSIPQKLSPLDGAQVNENGELVWSTAIDNDPGDVVTYTLELSLNQNFSSLVAREINLTDTMIVLKDLLHYIKLEALSIYYWRVKASDNNGASTDYGLYGIILYLGGPRPDSTVYAGNTVVDTGLYEFGGTEVEIKISTITGSDIILVKTFRDTVPPSLPVAVKTLNKYFDVSLGSGISEITAELNLTYTQEEFIASGIADELSLSCGHFDGTSWSDVPSTVDVLNNVVTCTATQFSIWAIQESVPNSIRESHFNKEFNKNFAGFIGSEVIENNFIFNIKVENLYKISIYSISGNRNVLRHNLLIAGKHHIPIPKSLAPGIYFLHLQGEGVNEIKKVVVVR